MRGSQLSQVYVPWPRAKTSGFLGMVSEDKSVFQVPSNGLWARAGVAAKAPRSRAAAKRMMSDLPSCSAGEGRDKRARRRSPERPGGHGRVEARAVRESSRDACGTSGTCRADRLSTVA